ncbi:MULTISPECIES: hypothetical protein [Bacillus]|uniref:Lipoprotein n=2 Tax=Bacillus pumilus TaxID=1408 RepID=A8F9Y7_BACP2|nr:MULTISPECIES: hypothetical protein [Bacillus]ABV61054.1 hypothetical protein BPUM_0359 [Bacillus pumilus SAFR-032]AVI39881.1 hypothetical protein C5Y82_02025 [Bacillus pumilus]MBC3644346.1 hypothetical protein [Bacillus pumilus]MBC3647949.1 hypothetical protein [Bacillus pumilus]MBC3651197.1 hypothetical protein [Bacillus pumilus]
MTRTIWTCLFMLLLATSLCACQSVQQFESKRPSAEEVLALDEQADLFQWGKTVYEANVDWTHQLTVTKDQQLGVIQKTAAKHFHHGTATHLKKGTAIYSVKERNDLLIAELNGQIIIYAAHAEG